MKAVLAEANRLARERQALDDRIDAVMQPLYLDLVARATRLAVDPRLSTELQALAGELTAWPPGIHRMEARTYLNLLDREA